ncbi:DUF2807 domain-containing protein [Reichenbachiella ulvae]|uniref:DUF2807 domain-containing protein n=1 Tax=Reichenbachiella ulvae TaxID=2980104 RepID=A0ABT3CWT6_9BACT|nr:DUF2807 domain-containing protein [Reichenbachiella ulvae]MCV9388036.1 DUF2807 domain-containing protein [Reichenbachiella ulvae]
MNTSYKNLMGGLMAMVGLLIFSSCEDEISPSSTVTTEEFTVGDFHAVEVSNDFDVEIFYSDEEYVLIESNENLHDFITAVQEDGKLRISLDGVNVSGNTILKARVYTNNPLDFISVNNASRLTATEAIFSDQVELHVNGASFLRTQLDVERLDVEVSNASNLEIQGSSNHIGMVVKAGGMVQDDRLVVNFANMDLSGASSAELVINQEIRLTASGSSVLRYAGDAVIKAIDLSTGATIEKIDA